MSRRVDEKMKKIMQRREGAREEAKETGGGREERGVEREDWRNERVKSETFSTCKNEQGLDCSFS